MTDKQIIIDVCPYQGECSVSGCKRNDDSCFVRQLFEERYRAENRIVELNKTIKAKEQECEELKERLNCNCFDPKNNNNRCISYNRIAEDYERDLRQLDQLKAENDTYKKMFEDEDVQLALNEVRTGERHLWFNKAEKLKQTLTEIKEIAEKNLNIHTCAFKGCGYDLITSQILQKISEVLE